MKQQTLRRMLGYVRPYRGQLALACTVALLSVLFTLCLLYTSDAADD